LREKYFDNSEFWASVGSTDLLKWQQRLQMTAKNLLEDATDANPKET
jgi:hypothetical protein